MVGSPINPSQQPQLLHGPNMGLFLPNSTYAIMHTLRMLYQIAPPLPEISLKLLGNVLAFDLLYQTIHPD